MGEVASRTVVLKDGTSVILRSGVESDAESILENLAVLLADGEGQLWEDGEFQPTLEQERAWISSMRGHPRQILIIAEFEGRVVGNIDFTVGGRRRLAHGGEFGMSVMPSWRGRGLGSRLLEALIEWAHGVAGLEKICLRVLSNNPRAQALYRKHGFVVEGVNVREIRYSDGTYADGVLMGLFL